MDLISFVRGGIRDDLAARLRAAIPAEFFSYPDGLAPLDRYALTYERFRHAGLAAPPASELLTEPAALCALLERAAVADPALFHVMLLHYTLVLAPIVRFGGESTAPIRNRLEAMESFGVVAMTEAGRSNSHLAPCTTARFEPDARSFVLTTPDAAAAKFPTTAGHPRIPKTAVVYARLVTRGIERGVFTFVVPLRDETGTVAEGADITPAPDGQHLPVDHAAVRFRELRVPFEAWLASGAQIAADGSFKDAATEGPGKSDTASEARLAISMATAPLVWRAVISASAAIARASATSLVHHCAGRIAMGGLAPGRPLLDQRSQQEAVINALARAYALTAVASHVKDAADAAAAGGPGKSSAAGAASSAWAPWAAVDRTLPLLKAIATAGAEEIASLCRVHSGAPGYAASGRLNGYRDLAHAYLSAGGDNQLILFDTARGLAEQDHPAEPSLEAPPSESSIAGCLAVAWRLEQRLTRRLADCVAKSGQLAAWDVHHRLAVRSATAHADRMILEILNDGPHQLRPLFHWYALEWCERRAGLLLDEGIVAAPLADRIASRRQGLLTELMLQADDLVAACELPELNQPCFWSASWNSPVSQH